MGTVTLSKQNRLFWLGRYAERVYATVKAMLDEYDRLIDGGGIDYVKFCADMGIPCPYESGDDFFRRYLFDPEDPCSVRSSAEAMLGNGMVLRETVGTPTLAYLQMARNALKLAEQSEGPAVQLQWVLDDIMAFRGSFDDAVELEGVSNITRSGGMVERISLTLRMGWGAERLEREARKLLNRLYKTDLPKDQKAVDVLTRFAVEHIQVEKGTLLANVEGLFLV